MVDDRTIAAALAQYLASAGLPADCGVSLRWVTVRLFGIPIAFPNWDARRRVLFRHDVHHLLTGYRTTWTGEAEIAAFELRTGCRDYVAAWFFNCGGWLFGLAIAPRRLFLAFVQARDCRNLYAMPRERIDGMTVEGGRRELGLTQPARCTTARDVGAFVLWSTAIVAVYVVAPLLLTALVVWLATNR